MDTRSRFIKLIEVYLSHKQMPQTREASVLKYMDEAFTVSDSLPLGMLAITAARQMVKYWLHSESTSTASVPADLEWISAALKKWNKDNKLLGYK